MIVERLPNGSPVFAGRWDEFKREWLKAPPAEKTILLDGRPAIRHEGEPPSYISIHPHVWDLVKTKLKALFEQGQAPKRVRLCEACQAEMAVRMEQEAVWIFKCPRCSSVEIHGKDRIGGTIGAGEREKT